MSVKIANKSLSSTFVKIATKASTTPKVEVFVFGSEVKEKERTEIAKSNLLTWQFKEWSKTKPSSFAGAGEKSAVLLVSAPKVSKEILERDAGLLSPSEYSSLRNALGSSLRKYLVAGDEASINLHFHDLSEAEILGSLVGIDLAAYSYKFPQTKINWFLGKVSKKLLDEAKNIAMGVNISRHLVNMPANELYPDSYAKIVKKLFPNKEGLKVDVWSYAKLKKEKMGLHLAVGEGSDNKPCLVHVRYRPSKKAPLALVGKGITFDTGGVDLKPASAMRLMKKDMGGSACLVGLVYSLVKQKSKQCFDLWLPLAENSVSGSAFRPGDVYISKQGKTVEIHNTDAEGRLVLADALTVATKQKAANKPTKVINVATLTGAVKVGIGTGMAGFYATSDKDAELMAKASTESGDFVWKLPLFAGYRRLLSSSVADINHCASSGFGGSITAALFLKEFTNSTPFMHFDIYSWQERPEGAICETGASGQTVQCLYFYMKS